MNIGRTVFSQLLDFLPRKAFLRCVERYRGNYRVRTFSCWDQYLCMAFAQLTYRESLRDIEVCLRAMPDKLYHMGLQGHVARSTLADANEQRDWRIYADFAQLLIAEARQLYAGEDFGLELEHTVYALDSSTIDLCLSLFPWAHFHQNKAAVKLHTLLDLRGNIPACIYITEGKRHDLNFLDQLTPEAGSIYIMDRGYIDFRRLHLLHQALAFFVIRIKYNTQVRRLYSQPVASDSGLRCDQTIVLTGVQTADEYPERLRRVKYFDADSDQRLVLLTNNFALEALTIAQLYRCRWRVEVFFKWLKQHLRIKAFYGTSENAVKIQLWIAISVYVLVAIIKKRLALELSPYTMLQILSLTLFEKAPLLQVLTQTAYTSLPDPDANQLELFDY